MAAHRSSSSSAATFPASTRSGGRQRLDGRLQSAPRPAPPVATAGDRRQLEDAPRPSRRDPDGAEAVVPSRQDDYEKNEVVVCPPFTDLRTLQTLIDSDRLSIRLGAQNCHWEDSGAYTGEVSPVMLAKLNVRYVIVGHSERRQLFGETDETVNLKLRAVVETRHDADRVRGRDARGARSRRNRRAGHVTDACGVCRRQGRGRRRVRAGLRADLGDRHRPQRHARGREHHDRGGPRRRPRSVTTTRPRRRSASSTAEA